MKKIILSLLAIAGIFASCSNDDIEVKTYGDLTYTISTQSVYDEFGVSDQFKGSFLSGDYNIGVWTFLYDTNGQLAASDSVFVKTFGQIERNFSYLPTGEYTTITVEMMVKESEGNISESFVIVGQDNLSTLQIARRKYYSAWYSAVGVATNVIQVSKGNNQKVDITPHAIGAYVDFIAANIDCSNYICVSFYTKDHPDGRFLSPDKKGEDRFYYKNYLEPNTWSRRGYIYHSSSDMFPNEAYGTAYLLEEGNINCVFGVQTETQLQNSKFTLTQKDGYKLKVEDGESYLGAVCYTGSNIEGILFDEYSYSNYQKWYNSLSIILDAEPYLVWGASASTVETYMKNSGMKFVQDGFDSENTLYYSYWVNYSNTLSYEYRFDTSKTNLSALLMVYSKSKYKKTEVLDELKTKFVYDGYNETFGGDFLYSEDSSTMLLVVENDEDFRVLYIGGLSSSAAPRSKSYVGSIFNEAKSLFKSNKK